ncbi:DUF2190 family protein [Bacillus sp. FJAT-45350]|uniref:DUF2190 family protein n=1 Tax=Bacillus sp. FJAT-45350 TaxID=2011014 RepID=UPI000BB6DAD2|nr:DUF2190 family protein [Bacillus sp. FJAT-45350]
MPYKGQPFPSTTYQVTRAKISDGKSVRVTVPENSEIEAQRFYLLGGFFGAATESVKTGEGETAEVVLTIEQAEYETSQISTTQEFTPGAPIYWNASTSRFTETDSSGEDEYRRVGRVTQGKDSNNVIWFILGPQV